MDEQGVHVDLTKIQVIHDWSTSKKMTELRSLLGRANFYHWFVLGFSHISWALSQVTKGGVNAKFVWSVAQQKAFKDLKSRLCLTLVLILPNPQKTFEIETNASDYAISVVLTQHGHPIAYHNETLTDIVRRYPTYDKDMYFIVQECRQWKHYIMGKETIIHTNHKPLQHADTRKVIE
jgi:hypothetical protein